MKKIRFFVYFTVQSELNIYHHCEYFLIHTLILSKIIKLPNMGLQNNAVYLEDYKTINKSPSTSQGFGQVYEGISFK